MDTTDFVANLLRSCYGGSYGETDVMYLGKLATGELLTCCGLATGRLV